ncbi:MAG: VTT domain-containing protein [Granulosicoccus sp.]|nr:VTT domain-containing protein [Granulosicoccus sp.]
MAHTRSRLTLALIALLAVIVIGVVIFPPERWVPAARWGEFLQSSGVNGVLLFMLSSVLATSVGLPRQMIAFIAGLAYGTSAGLLMSLISALLGCYLTVWFSHRFLSSWVVNRFPRVIDTLNRLVRRDLFLKVLVLRLQPLGTNLMTNVCIGFTDASRMGFLAASAVGYVPQMLVFALLGSGVRVGSDTQIGVSIGLLCMSLILGAYLVKKHIDHGKPQP